MGAFHGCVMQDRELRPASPAMPVARTLQRQCVGDLAALVTDRTLRPANRFKMGDAGRLIREYVQELKQAYHADEAAAWPLMKSNRSA